MPQRAVIRPHRRAERRERFSAVMATISSRLPLGLSRIVPPTLLGFAVVNGFTFSVDLILLTVLHSGLHWPLPLSITISYIIAFGLSFLLNRTLNFRSHSDIGPQIGIYAVVVVVNYLVCILGVGSGLTVLGVEYHVARIIAGLCEAAYMYSAMRWVVFRGVHRSTDAPTPTDTGTHDG